MLFHLIRSYRFLGIEGPLGVENPAPTSRAATMMGCTRKWSSSSHLFTLRKEMPKKSNGGEMRRETGSLKI